MVSCYTAREKTFLLGIPVTRDKRRGRGGLRKGGWADELPEDSRVWSQPETSREPKPPDFPSASIRALQTSGTSRKPGNRRGQAFLVTLEAVSFFFHHSSRLRNVPKLGAGNPGLLSSRNPAVTPGTRWRWTELEWVTQSLLGSAPWSLLWEDAPLFGGKWGRLVLAADQKWSRGGGLLPNHGDPKSPVKVKAISPPFPTTLPQEAQMPPQQACEEGGPLAFGPQPHNWRHPDMQSQPGLPVPAGRHSRPHLLPP